ncbi:fibronectin type III domain-containing protein [Patescibacteria group bacterium]
MKKLSTLIYMVVLLMGFLFLHSTVDAQDPDAPPIIYISAHLNQEAEKVSYSIDWRSTEPITGNIKYGTSLGNYTETITGNVQGSNRVVAVLTGLEYDTAYYYQVTAIDGADNQTVSGENTFSTTKRGIAVDNIEIDGITDTSAFINVNLSKEGIIKYNYGTVSDTLPNEVYSLGGGRAGAGGLVHVRKIEPLNPSTTYYIRFTASVSDSYRELYGVLDADADVTSDILTFTTLASGQIAIADNAVTSAYGCAFSISGADENTIRINKEFTTGSDIDTYFKRVYNAYYGVWNRYPRCTEMQFHYDHSTPIERLVEWLNSEALTEKFGCKISTTTAGDDTIRLSSKLTPNNSDDQYLEQVYTTYNQYWNRYPRCTEMQFHIDHSTPIDRLSAWLQENIPVEAPTAGLTSVLGNVSIMEFIEAGEVITAKTGTTLQFTDDEAIKFSGTTQPNATVILSIASQETLIATTFSNGDGDWSYTLPGPLEPGEHKVQIKIIDTKGDNISQSEAINFNVTTTNIPAATTTATTATEDSTKFGLGAKIWLTTLLVAVVLVLLIMLVAKAKKN